MNINDYLIKNKLLTKESHPYNEESLKSKSFKNARILIVGTFPPLRFTEEGKKLGLELDPCDVDWFYGSKDNGFWSLIANTLNKGKSINDKTARINFAKENGIAFLDLFQEIQRYRHSSSDQNILPTRIIHLYKILENCNNIKFVIFTVRWAATIAKKEHHKYYGKYIKSYKLENNLEYFTIKKKDVKCFLIPSSSSMLKLQLKDKERKYSTTFHTIKLN